MNGCQGDKGRKKRNVTICNAHTIIPIPVRQECSEPEWLRNHSPSSRWEMMMLTMQTKTQKINCFRGDLRGINFHPYFRTC